MALYVSDEMTEQSSNGTDTRDCPDRTRVKIVWYIYVSLNCRRKLLAGQLYPSCVSSPQHKKSGSKLFSCIAPLAHWFVGDMRLSWTTLGEVNAQHCKKIGWWFVSNLLSIYFAFPYETIQSLTNMYATSVDVIWPNDIATVSLNNPVANNDNKLVFFARLWKRMQKIHRSKLQWSCWR